MKGLLLLVFALLMGIESNAEELFSVRRVYGFPAGERGIEQGVSACFAGAIGHRLLMAGGCNFPEVPAALHDALPIWWEETILSRNLCCPPYKRR